jgi:hypothetical protein
MVKQSSRILIIFILLVPVLLGVWVMIPSERHVQKYHDLMHQSQSKRSSKQKKDPFVAIQYREGVIKDIHYRRGDSLLQARVVSDRSHLVFDQQPNGMDILEHMEQLTCAMQKELFYVTDDVTVKPMQIIRFVKADKATYYYNKEMLLADHPIIIEYRVEGHHLPENYDDAVVMMRSVAENVEISFDNAELTFHAKRLKGRVFPQGEVL